MCGRFASHHSADEIRHVFGTTRPPPNLVPSWNVAPTDPAMMIRRQPDIGDRQIDLLHWEPVPHFTKDLKAAWRSINARCEALATFGMFHWGAGDREAIRKHRRNISALEDYDTRAVKPSCTRK